MCTEINSNSDQIHDYCYIMIYANLITETAACEIDKASIF